MEPILPTPVERRFGHGLVVGKFFPPHAGHLYLVRAAAQVCATVTVGVFDRECRALPLAVRAAALRRELAAFPNLRFVAALDDAPIDYADPAVWDRHVAVFRAGVATALAAEGKSLATDPLDAVFTSEAYGDELGRRLGCLHVALDPDRAWQPVSGTALRADPVKHWGSLSPLVRAALCRRVVVLGAESTGTTTLARDLARSFGADAVPEFGREYSALKLVVERALAKARGAPVPGMEAIAWTAADFLHIARVQSRWEEAAAQAGGPVLVADTDALATEVWHERYRGAPLPALEPLIAALPRRALYILTDHDGVPFEDDGLRDGEHLRAWMTGRFAAELARRGLPVLRVTGTKESRLARARAAVAESLSSGWDFRPD